MGINDTSLQITVEAKDQTTHVLKGIESGVIRFVGAVSATLAAINVVVFPIKQAAEFQRELLNVGKTTEFTGEQLDKLSSGLKEMSTRLNVSAVDLAKVAAAGGQLGLGKEGVEGILAYTEATSRFASVLDVSVEQAGSAIGKLSNLFSISIKDAERISSTINEISNNSTASGAELLDIIQRIGTAGGTLTLQQSAALAAYGKDLGLTSETVGTTLNKIFLDLQTKAAAVGPLVGMSVREFADLVKTDGIGAFKLYVGALEKMDNVTRATLSEQITGGGRIAAFVQAATNDAANGFKLLDKELVSTNKGWTTGTSAIKEQERVLSGLLAQITILGNVFTSIAETVGRKALPYLTDLVRKAQELGKDPAVIAFFTDFGTALGRWATVAVDVVSALSSMSSVVGPLIRLLEVWISLKIASAIFGWGKALYDSGKAAAVATKGWFDLITVNKQAITTMAAAADQARKTNAELAAQGKAPSTKVNALGSAASGLNSLFKPYWEAQDRSVKTEAALNATIAKRDQILGGILKRMQDIKATSAATAQQAYDDAIASGSTKKVATLAKRDTLAALRKEYDDLDVRGTNLFTRYTDAIIKLNTEHTKAADTATALGNTAGGMLARITTAARGAATAIFAIGESFLAVASRILGAVFILQFLLDMFGLLDPLLKLVRSVLGIRTEEEAQAARASAARDKALVDERKRVAELAAEYNKASDTWGTALPTDKDGSLQSVANRLSLIQAKIKDMAFSAGEFTAGMQYSTVKVQTLTTQLDAAKQRLASLQNTKPIADAFTGAKTFLFPVLGKDGDTTARDIEKARTEVDRLTVALDLAKQAQTFYAEEVKKSGEYSGTVYAQEQAAIAELAKAYNAEGYAILKSLTMVAQKREELKKAEEAAAAQAGTADNKQATDKELEAYTLSLQKVRTLTVEVGTLNTAYERMKAQAGLASLSFIKSLGINETTASVEQLNNAVSVFGGITGETTAGITQRVSEMNKEIQDTEASLAGLEGKSARAIQAIRIQNRDPSGAFDKTRAAEAEITNEYNAQIAALKAKLQAQLASKSSLDRELSTAQSLKAAYEKGGASAANARAQSAALIRSFLNNAATVQFVGQQLDAQRKIVDGAKLHAEQMKSAYEASLKDVSGAIKSAADDINSLHSYFASRQLNLRLAVFDKTAKQQAEFFTESFSTWLEEDKKRLQIAGLSTEEYNKQVKELEKHYALMAKGVELQQSEAKQAFLLNELRGQIATAQDRANTAQKQALDYARQAKEADKAGNKDAAITLGEKAAVQAELAKVAIDDMTSAMKDFKSEAAKPVETQLGAKLLVSDQEITDMTKRAAEARVQVSKAVSSSLEQANQAAADGLAKQFSAMDELAKRGAAAEAKVREVIQLVPELAGLQTTVGESLIKQAEGVAAVSEVLKSIAMQDFRGLSEFRTVSEQVGSFKQIEQSIDNIATTSAEKLTDVVTKAKELPVALRAAYQITDEELQKASSVSIIDKMREVVNAADPIGGKIQFPEAKTALQTALDSGDPVTAKVKLDLVASSKGVGGYATGGLVTGPGTGTSDSILSWLSNKEYVMDAHTTSVFGSSFFATLQRMARGGGSVLRGILSSKFGLPAFASGGYVSKSAVSLLDSIPALSGNTDTVTVKFDLGGKVFKMRSEREEAAALAKTLRNLTRSS